MIVFLHRNDGVPVVAGAGVRLQVLLRQGAHTLAHVLDDATVKLGLHTAATGLCSPDGTAIVGLDDLTPKCDLVVLEGRKGFIAPGGDPKRPRAKSPGRTTSPSRASSERPASLPRHRPRTPPRSAGLRAPASSLSTGSTPRVSTHNGQLTAGSQSTGTESVRRVARPATLRATDPMDNRASQESPARSRVVRVTLRNPAREVALQRRGQRSSRQTKLGAQLLENRRKHAAAKQAKLKRELVARHEELVTSCDNASASSDVSAVETRSWGNLAETWTPPPLERVSSIDSSVAIAFGRSDGMSIEAAPSEAVQASLEPTQQRNATQEPEPAPESEPEPEPEQKIETVPRWSSLQDSPASPAALGDTYADLYVQVRAIYNTAHSALQQQLATTPGSARDPLLVRMADLVGSLDALAADIGAMPAGATVGSTVQVSQFGETIADPDTGKTLSSSGAVVDYGERALATTGSVQTQQRLRKPPSLPVTPASAADKPGQATATSVSDGVDVVKESAAAVSIQARVRGRQDRRRAAVQKLVALRETRDDMAAERECCLDLPIGEWLAAQNESTLSGKLQEEFSIQNLWDLVAVIQDPWDLTVVLDEPDPARSDALWKAIQQLVAQASDQTAGWTDSHSPKSREQVPIRFTQTGDDKPDSTGDSNSIRMHVDDNGDSMGRVLSFALTDSVDNLASTPRVPPPLPQTYSSTDEGKEDASSFELRQPSVGQSPASKESGQFTPTSFRA